MIIIGRRSATRKVRRSRPTPVVPPYVVSEIIPP
jgi:hypothetical protein